MSPTTFFRYFPTKAEVVLSSHGQHLPALYEAIAERPAGESDLTAVRRGVTDAWIAAIDPERTVRKATAVAASPELQGLSYQRGHLWLETVTDALARRRGLDAPDDRCVLAARVVLGVLGSVVEGWIAGGCVGELTDAVERGFDAMTDLCREWGQG